MVSNRTYYVKRYRINKTKLVASLMAIAVLLAVSALSVYGAVNGNYLSYGKTICTEYTVIEVAYGDSLWSIAKSFGGDDQDLRAFVNKICKINGIENSFIYPGQQLLVPSY